MSAKLSPTSLIAIFGKRGSGKSTLCKNLQAAFHRVVVIDLMHEYSHDEADFVVDSVEDLARILISLTWSPRVAFRIVLQFDPEKTEDEREAFDTAMHLIYQFGGCMVVIEEIHHYTRNEWVPEWLRKLILIGRHRGVGIIATSQKPATVSKVFTSQCDHWFIAQMFERNDLKYFFDCIGAPSEVLPSLEKYKFLHYIPGQDPRIISNR